MTQPFNHGAFVDALRARRGKIPADLYDDMMFALDKGIAPGAPIAAAPAKPVSSLVIIPSWIAEARLHIGEKEIVGPKHSGFILGMLKRLGGPFTDDETPWCGTFVGYCMVMAGQSVIPKHWYRALAWAEWGVPCKPVVGAIAVFSRQGGGHVGFVVGESDDNYYVLGGNQSNMVSITPISKSRSPVFRWPAGVPVGVAKLPRMSGGTVSKNEQ